jgi:hypothetical protein
MKLTNFGLALTQSFEKLDNWLTAKISLPAHWTAINDQL